MMHGSAIDVSHRYMLLADYEAYIAAQEKVSAAYAVSTINVLVVQKC